ncbi:hypothetical protein, partial [Halorubrum ezzemoulense]|uniref:hypothetical protein n=1 Tax=Halorubrum ezzemoulense TaxID=337243 RepID=UPI001C52BE28
MASSPAISITTKPEPTARQSVIPAGSRLGGKYFLVEFVYFESIFINLLYVVARLITLRERRSANERIEPDSRS